MTQIQDYNNKKYSYRKNGSFFLKKQDKIKHILKLERGKNCE